MQPSEEGRRRQKLHDIGTLEKHEEKPLGHVDSEVFAALPRPLVIDSGAAETVMPSDWLKSHGREESTGSQNGTFYTTADGSAIYNEGQTFLKLAAPDGTRARFMTFQLAKVIKALGSVSKIMSNGNRLVFNSGGSRIENLWSGDKAWLREENGVYVLDMLVAPPEPPAQTFAR